MIPIMAPAKTSLSQWRLFNCLVNPVTTAGKKVAIPARGVLKPYSLYSSVAAVKAVAVCPEGNERKSAVSYTHLTLPTTSRV